MQTIRQHEFGGPEVLVLVEVPTPAPGAGQILIRVESASVNFADVLRRRGDIYPFPTPLPFTPGSEVAGTVEALGDGVDGPPVGTPVFALVGGDGSTGYAQYAVADAQQVIPTPPTLSSDEAASIVVAGAAAVLMLTEAAAIKPGETVLVQGAGGGVGGYAVQVAKLLGAAVIATASTPGRREAALAAGADHVVDPTVDDWTDGVRAIAEAGVDAVLDISGGPVSRQSLGLLAPFGRFVVAGMASGEPIQLDDETVRGVFYDPALNQSLIAFNLGAYFGLRPQAAVAALQTLIGYVASGQVKVKVGHVLPLSAAAEAHGLLENRRSVGKIVSSPGPSAHTRTAPACARPSCSCSD
jgi:NADPH:quinone reductase-like Zn-dependent oxidoreductase